jgi:RNA polymerase sigma-70 factor (ECF subfamily)
MGCVGLSPGLRSERRTALSIPPEEWAERRARERELVERAKAGDAAAFEQLYRENVGRVYAVCYRMAGDPTLAEELTQDAFVRAWSRLGSFRGDSAFSTWLHPLAVNVALTERRSRRRRLARVVAVEDVAEVAGAGVESDPSKGFDLDMALSVLPPGAREVFVMHDAYGYKHDEIAEMTGVATGTSKAQLHRARQLLRDALTRVTRRRKGRRG